MNVLECVILMTGSLFVSVFATWLLPSLSSVIPEITPCGYLYTH